MSIFDKYGEFVFMKAMKLLSFWDRLRGKRQSFVESSLSKQKYDEMLLASYRQFTNGEIRPRTKEEVERILAELKSEQK